MSSQTADRPFDWADWPYEKALAEITLAASQMAGILSCPVELEKKADDPAPEPKKEDDAFGGLATPRYGLIGGLAGGGLGLASTLLKGKKKRSIKDVLGGALAGAALGGGGGLISDAISGRLGDAAVGGGLLPPGAEPPLTPEQKKRHGEYTGSFADSSELGSQAPDRPPLLPDSRRRAVANADPAGLAAMSAESAWWLKEHGVNHKEMTAKSNEIDQTRAEALLAADRQHTAGSTAWTAARAEIERVANADRNNLFERMREQVDTNQQGSKYSSRLGRAWRAMFGDNDMKGGHRAVTALSELDFAGIKQLPFGWSRSSGETMRSADPATQFLGGDYGLVAGVGAGAGLRYATSAVRNSIANRAMLRTALSGGGGAEVQRLLKDFAAHGSGAESKALAGALPRLAASERPVFGRLSGRLPFTRWSTPTVTLGQGPVGPSLPGVPGTRLAGTGPLLDRNATQNILAAMRAQQPPPRPGFWRGTARMGARGLPMLLGMLPYMIAREYGNQGGMRQGGQAFGDQSALSEYRNVDERVRRHLQRQP